MHESLDEFEFRQICNRVNVRIEFLLNILKTNRPIKTKFCIHIIIDKIYVGNVFRKFATELRPLIGARIWFLLNILRMN